MRGATGIEAFRKGMPDVRSLAIGVTVRNLTSGRCGTDVEIMGSKNMAWFTIQQPGHLVEALFHFNEALDREEQGSLRKEVSRFLFDALNKIQTEWVSLVAEQTMGEVKAFQTMILEGLHEESRHALLASDELKTLAEFEPPILNHDVLRRRDYRPGVEVGPDLTRDASKVHRKFKTAYNDLATQKQKEIEERVLKQAAELLYVVRSKIAHGEKTPYGPDLKKSVGQIHAKALKNGQETDPASPCRLCRGKPDFALGFCGGSCTSEVLCSERTPGMCF